MVKLNDADFCPESIWIAGVFAYVFERKHPKILFRENVSTFSSCPVKWKDVCSVLLYLTGASKSGV